jgi:hypothetical protein
MSAPVAKSKRARKWRAAKMWRVEWRRPAWRATTEQRSRSFAHGAYAFQFAARLRDHGPVTYVRVQVRDVHMGPWRDACNLTREVRPCSTH